ncbi:plexin-B-like [Lingula anatina]|uniref:Hepatocyte growth factor receptor n=1 Tax=Lingula anatina TaxID=7574 RepID=A0A2R2MKD0_LINAN|nr:plexin-B-like [Lingula anatina]|eukprot:XP_023930655.1 plexin-B-like [Lingula anatina]
MPLHCAGSNPSVLFNIAKSVSAANLGNSNVLSYNYGSNYCNHDYGGVNTPLVSITPATSSPGLTTSSSTWTAVATTTTTSYTVAFVGTADGQLKKILIQSNTSAVEYATVQVSSDQVKHILLDSTGEHMYVMTKYKVSKLKVEDCGSYSSCEDCLASKDPFCGWCSLENKCSRKSQCSDPDAAERWLPFDNPQCTKINTISPSNTPLARPTQVNMSVSLLPPGQTYQCVFDTTAVTATVTGGNLVTCDTPTNLPTIPVGDDHITIPLSIKSVTTGVKFLTTNFTYFDCSAHSGCVSCTSSSWACNWCIYANRCTHASSTCSPSGGVIPGQNSRLSVGIKGPTLCPQLLPRAHDVLLPAGVPKLISLIGKNIPVPQAGQGGYLCKIGTNTVQAIRQNDSAIDCQNHAYIYTANTGQEKHQIQVIWNNNHVIDQPTGSEVSATLYKCDILGTTCGTCIGGVDTKFRCAFCGGTCKYHPTCRVPTDSTCPNVIINWVTPLSAPVEGHTKVTISGTNLGTSDASIPTVRLAGVVCRPVVEDYVVSKRIVCTAAEAPGRLARNGSVEVQVQGLGKVYRHSQMFRYVDPRLETVFPVKGPIAGGTRLTVRGKDLNVGNLDNISLTLGEEMLPCIVDRSTIGSHSTICATPGVSRPKVVTSVRMFFDGSVRMLDQNPFTYTEDPVVEKIMPLTSFVSGGRILTVIGKNFDSIQQPKIFVWNGKEKSHTTYCLHIPEMSSTTLTCPSPRAPNGIHPTIPDTSGSLRFKRQMDTNTIANIGFVMDGVVAVQNLTNITSSIQYVVDPLFQNLTSDGSSVKYQSNTSFVIRGYYLNLAASEADVTVLIGGHNCDVTGLAPSILVCKPPHFDYGNKLVAIRMGNLNYQVGYLNYGDPPMDHSAVNYGWVAGLIVPIVALTVTGIVTGVVVYKRRAKRATTNHKGASDMEYLGLSSQFTPPRVINTIEDALMLVKDGDLKVVLKPVLVSRDRIKIGKLIGTGHFGCVFEGIYEDSEHYNPSKVAVKTFQGKGADIQHLDEFLREGALMTSFRHDHVLTILGICFEVDGNPMIILPYMANGDLKTYIENPKNAPTGLQLLQFGLDVARGMEYLAENKFVHRDLAARNCMLDDQLRAKVADFGLTRDVYTKEYYSSRDKQAKLPVKWMAPESMERNVYTFRSDVWSFGVLLWELFTRGKVPYPGVDGWDVLQFLKLGRRLDQPDYCPQKVYQLMLKCWSWEPEERPDFTSIVTQIEETVRVNTEVGGEPGHNEHKGVDIDDHMYTEVLP